MTDVHSHILFNIDDGSDSIEESITLLKELKSIGFTDIILTPHYIKGSEYSANNQTKIERFSELKEEIKKQNIGINIYLGNEIFVCNNILELLERKEIFSLNNTKYLLIELPFHNQILNLEDIIYEINLKGYIPIIAHPERYEYFQKNYKLIDNLREMDVMFQCNYVSILGYYGKSAEKLIKYMLKNKYVDYLGTDIHHIKKTFVIDNFDKIKKKIIKIAGITYFENINNNANSLIHNEE